VDGGLPQPSLKGSRQSNVPGGTLYSVSSTQNIYIAVVDDDDAICRSMSRLLRAAHLYPITYPSAEAFLGDTKHPKFDCLVLDIRLEGMSGLELHERLLAVKSGTPVVFITAQDDPEVRAQAEASGCAGYFRKTDSGADVLAAIRHAVGLADSDSGRKPEKPTDPEPTP
jgi:FixJ family two-component response regulator